MFMIYIKVKYNGCKSCFITNNIQEKWLVGSYLFTNMYVIVFYKIAIFLSVYVLGFYSFLLFDKKFVFLGFPILRPHSKKMTLIGSLEALIAREMPF